ncbi:hypothetical protein BV20DRAFT_347444 [Pilatotrama ljubarskyi]|nr:hypothetical protein BV20DRAFT_347444 [Pilatotrama ljubarskyi]
MTAYHWFGASQLVPSPHSEHSCSPDSHKEEPAGNRSGPSLVAAGCVEGARSQCPTASAQFPEFDGDPVVYGDGVQNLSSYSIARSRHPDLVCDTVSPFRHLSLGESPNLSFQNVGYALLGNQRLRPSPNHTVLPAAASFPQSYYDEGPYSESPSDDSLQGDSFTNPGMSCARYCYALLTGRHPPRLRI